MSRARASTKEVQDLLDVKNPLDLLVKSMGHTFRDVAGSNLANKVNRPWGLSGLTPPEYVQDLLQILLVEKLLQKHIFNKRLRRVIEDQRIKINASQKNATDKKDDAINQQWEITLKSSDSKYNEILNLREEARQVCKVEAERLIRIPKDFLEKIFEKYVSKIGKDEFAKIKALDEPYPSPLDNIVEIAEETMELFFDKQEFPAEQIVEKFKEMYRRYEENEVKIIRVDYKQKLTSLIDENKNIDSRWPKMKEKVSFYFSRTGKSITAFDIIMSPRQKRKQEESSYKDCEKLYHLLNAILQIESKCNEFPQVKKSEKIQEQIKLLQQVTDEICKKFEDSNFNTISDKDNKLEIDKALENGVEIKDPNSVNTPNNVCEQLKQILFKNRMKPSRGSIFMGVVQEAKQEVSQAFVCVLRPKKPDSSKPPKPVQESARKVFVKHVEAILKDFFPGAVMSLLSQQPISISTSSQTQMPSIANRDGVALTPTRSR